ncbi:MAG: glycosyltransferase family 9 protein [bacterium]
MKRKRDSRFGKILILRTSRLDDIYERVRELYPSAEITALLPRDLKGRFAGNPHIDRIIVYPGGRLSRLSLGEMLNEMRRENFDAVAISYGAVSSYRNVESVALACRPRYILAYDGERLTPRGIWDFRLRFMLGFLAKLILLAIVPAVAAFALFVDFLVLLRERRRLKELGAL